MALFIGSGNAYGGGFTRVLRYASCNRVTLTYNEGGAQEVTAQLNFIGLFEQAGSPLTPDPTALAAMGAPVAFQNLLSFYIGNEDFRTIAGSTTITVDNSLEAKGIQPDTGDNLVTSRIPYALLPHNEVASFSSTWHDSNIMIDTDFNTPGLAPLRTTAPWGSPAGNATDWSNNNNVVDPIILTLDNTASGTVPATTVIVTAQLARLLDFNQPEADSNTEQMGNISALVSQVQINES